MMRKTVDRLLAILLRCALISCVCLSLLLVSCGLVIPGGNAGGGNVGTGSGDNGGGNNGTKTDEETENGGEEEEEENGGEEENGESTGPSMDELLAGAVWYPYSDLYLITESTGSWRDEFVDVFTYETDGVTLVGWSDAKEKRPHEIVIGESTREVSRLAYNALEELLDGRDGYGAYVIYAYEGSLAIAYSGQASMHHAISTFLEKCLLNKLEVPDGSLLSECYLLTEKAEQNREKMYEENLKKIKNDLLSRGVTNADDIIAGIERLYSLYDVEQLYWLAGLYDPELGAFYYSDTGRDNFGYLPDLESTSQALTMLDRGGLFDEFGGLSKHGIPESMREPLLNFVRSMQSSTDGFFYHPQWGSAISNSRRGRDLDNAVSLLGYLKERPYYNEPSGRMAGIYGAPGNNAVKPVAYLTSPLGTAADLSAIIPASSALPYYLQSLDAWAQYIDKLNVPGDSYSAGNTLVSDWSLIKSAGKEYVEYVINYLNETQIPEIGLWEYNTPDNDYDPTDGIGFNGTNGLMKISVLYSSLGYPVPNAYNALKSAIKVGLYKNTGSKEETVCYVLNIWTCLGGMIGNVKKNDAANYPAARALLMESAPALLDSSYDILKTHLRDDGGFAYREVSAMNISQGALVGYADGAESDVNATMVATCNTVGAMLGTLEVSGMPLWCTDDYYLFMDALESVGAVVKDPKSGVETFDNGYSTSNLTLSLSGYTSSVQDGALKIASNSGVTGGAINVKMKKASGSGKTHVFDAHLKIDKAELGDVLNLEFRSSDGKRVLTSLTLECYSDGGVKKLRLKDTYAGADGKKTTLIDGLELGEWHFIRMLTYKSYSPSYSVKTKVIVNDKYIATTDSSVMSGSSPLDITLGSCRIGIVGKNVELWVDNTYSEKNYNPYT